MNARLDLELWLRRQGWPALAATGALVSLSLAMLGWAVTRDAAPAVVPVADAAARLEARQRAFRALLLPRAELEARQQAVLEAALRHGLSAGRIDYGYEERPEGRFGVAFMQLPLHGGYIDFRGFLAAILAEQPALAIENLAIRRAAGGGIEAELRLGFHVEPGRAGR